MLDLSHLRDHMVDVQVARRGIRDPNILDAMRRVPREAFVEAALATLTDQRAQREHGDHPQRAEAGHQKLPPT